MIYGDTPYYGPLNQAAPHGVELNRITQRMFTCTVRNMRFYDAITTIALAAQIHGTDKAVLKSMWTVLSRVQPDKQPLILNMMTAKSPLAHIHKVIDSMPKGFLELEINKMRLEELQAVVGVQIGEDQSMPLKEAA